MYKNEESILIKDFVEKSYLDYSMYVILDRALPHIADGLKPVQRRIIYAMSELGLSAQSKHKKSARTVGDVLGKYHPHGDSACYEAMVLMAQSFSYRYPLINGQGNWGSIDDPKSFAAMRYTESKLTNYAQTLLRELNNDVVPWHTNFDGTLKEPTLLPAMLPNILLNGATGIAVGMSTDIPPHNIKNIVDSCLALIDNPNIDDLELIDLIEGPDYPTYGELITPKNDLQQIYLTGSGSIKLRASYSIEDKLIVINSLPFQISSTKILEQIAAQIIAKKLPMIDDLRDESDQNNLVRIVLIPKSNRVDLDQVMSHLFATTDLEKNYRINLNMIGLNKKPQIKPLKVVLNEWLLFRKEAVTNRLKSRLKIVEERLHLLVGLMKVFLDLDEVINIIREDEFPKKRLIDRFTLTTIQADYILDTKLRQLARIEEIKIKTECEKLEKEQKELNLYLSSSNKLTSLIRKEIKKAGEEFSDQRRTKIIERESSKVICDSALIPSEPVTVILSKMGWVRLAKGNQVEASELSYKVGDKYLTHISGRSNQMVVFITDDGRVFSLPAHTLPSARGLGEPLSGRLTIGGRQFTHVLLDASDKNYLFITTKGYGFISCYSNMIARAKAGKSFISLSGGELLAPIMVPDNANYLLIITDDRRVLLIDKIDIVELGRGKGNKLIHFSANQKKDGVGVYEFFVLKGDETLSFKVGRSKEKLPAEIWINWLDKRGKRGNLLPKGLEKYKFIEIIN